MDVAITSSVEILSKSKTNARRYQPCDMTGCDCHLSAEKAIIRMKNASGTHTTMAVKRRLPWKWIEFQCVLADQENLYLHLICKQIFRNAPATMFFFVNQKEGAQFHNERGQHLD